MRNTRKILSKASRVVIQVLSKASRIVSKANDAFYNAYEAADLKKL